MLAAPPAVECEDVCDGEATTGLTDEIGFSELNGGESKLRELQRPSNSPNKHPFELEPKSHERYETTNDIILVSTKAKKNNYCDHQEKNRTDPGSQFEIIVRVKFLIYKTLDTREPLSKRTSDSFQKARNRTTNGVNSNEPQSCSIETMLTIECVTASRLVSFQRRCVTAMISSNVCD